MKVSELMHTPPVVCDPSNLVRDVAQLMQARDVGCVMVVDQGGGLVGIVSDRDLALRVVGQGRSGDVAIDSVMTRDVATVSPHAPVETAHTIMHERGVRRLPVTEDDGRLHGLIAMDDLLAYAGATVDALTETLQRQRERSGDEG
ncbi:MAG: cyclic nucleotide-binding/CBS domain-containing protein [Acidimicrobiales bacterium]